MRTTEESLVWLQPKHMPACELPFLSLGLGNCCPLIAAVGVFVCLFICLVCLFLNQKVFKVPWFSGLRTGVSPAGAPALPRSRPVLGCSLPLSDGSSVFSGTLHTLRDVVASSLTLPL